MLGLRHGCGLSGLPQLLQVLLLAAEGLDRVEGADGTGADATDLVFNLEWSISFFYPV